MIYLNNYIKWKVEKMLWPRSTLMIPLTASIMVVILAKLPSILLISHILSHKVIYIRKSRALKLPSHIQLGLNPRILWVGHLLVSEITPLPRIEQIITQMSRYSIQFKILQYTSNPLNNKYKKLFRKRELISHQLYLLQSSRELIMLTVQFL